MQLKVVTIVMLVTLVVTAELKKGKSPTCKKTDIENVMTTLNELKTETQNCSAGNVDIANDVSKAKATIEGVESLIYELLDITYGIRSSLPYMQEKIQEDIQNIKCESEDESMDFCWEEFLISRTYPRVEDDALTASSEWNSNLGPSRARLGTQYQDPFAGAWSPKTADLNQWIQVDLGRLVQVNGVVTQGRSDQDHWTKSYKVSYSEDGESFKFAKIDQTEVKTSYMASFYVKHYWFLVFVPYHGRSQDVK
ncbi:unnamed protein product [Owenia fusiformis]|uniref:Uncharacterized protein n=1 Tax=Owenia fusiformis TaxID=6347 RepID=A0A8J1XMD9_OWEFU|nr:unnamed protein product [Owenia fusiformis]